MGRVVNRWVVLENIADFQEKIRAEKDPERRRVLRELLLQEHEKLRQRDLEG